MERRSIATVAAGKRIAKKANSNFISAALPVTAVTAALRAGGYSRVILQSGRAGETEMTKTIFTAAAMAVFAALAAAPTAFAASPDETVIYTQWEHETHRNHQDLNKRSPDEQKQYSDWRSNHH